MPRSCFVIMPFSSTESCTQTEWTEIFDDVFKRGIEAAGLDYECKRSEATRGNIIAGIIRDLNDSYVVVADLTDRNANVFYELGVRHSLKNRTIILAQKMGDIPFDLQAYAYHVYGWRTREEREALATKLRELLEEIDNNPDRPDNPVADSLGLEEVRPEPVPVEVPAEASAYAQPLLGPGAEGLDPEQFAQRLARDAPPQSARLIYRLTRAALMEPLTAVLDELNNRDQLRPTTHGDVEELASNFISAALPLIRPVEVFALTSIEQSWSPGVNVGLQFTGSLMSIRGSQQGRTSQTAQGIPKVLAWRMLILLGAKAMADEEFEILRDIMLTPIEVEEPGGRFSNRSLPQRRDLFWPDIFYGNALLGIRYLISIGENDQLIQRFFGSKDDFHFALSKFLMLVALAYSNLGETRDLYPGYRVVPQSRRAMMAVSSRLAENADYRESIAKVIGLDSGESLLNHWSELAGKANATGLGSQFFASEGVRFPDPLDESSDS